MTLFLGLANLSSSPMVFENGVFLPAFLAPLWTREVARPSTPRYGMAIFQSLSRSPRLITSSLSLIAIMYHSMSSNQASFPPSSQWSFSVVAQVKGPMQEATNTPAEHIRHRESKSALLLSAALIPPQRRVGMTQAFDCARSSLC